jgi:hypothetical protein
MESISQELVYTIFRKAETEWVGEPYILEIGMVHKAGDNRDLARIYRQGYKSKQKMGFTHIIYRNIAVIAKYRTSIINFFKDKREDQSIGESISLKTHDLEIPL